MRVSIPAELNDEDHTMEIVEAGEVVVGEMTRGRGGAMRAGRGRWRGQWRGHVRGRGRGRGGGGDRGGSGSGGSNQKRKYSE